MAGRKTFTAGEVLQAADVNDFLMDQSVMVFAGTAARGSAIPSPTEGMVTYREDDNLVEVYNGSSFVPLGGILQVIQAEKTDTQSSSVASASTVTVSSLSASITPSSTSNKVLVTVDLALSAGSDTGGTFPRLLRDSTAIGLGAAAGSRTPVTAAAGALFTSAEHMTNTSFTVLDTPSTTSAIAYTVELLNSRNTDQTIFVNRPEATADLARLARAASRITLMEVAG